ncbi:MAG: nucleotide pyrophosphohydrolase [Chitinophagaceae bacterium]|nr:nucleotide pyrophosphohydrolase [Chitinophagaceae bacterium]
MELSKLQQIIKDRYYSTDSARGIYHTALWFHEEVGELSSAIASGDKENAKEEFADVLMWLMTLANLMEVDMEEAVAAYLRDPRKQPSK